MRKFYTNTIVSTLFKRNARLFCNSDPFLKKHIDINYDKLMDTFKTEPKELVMYQKQCVWRAKNLGMKELDLACGVWAGRYMHTMSREECNRFEKDILELETPVLYKLILEVVDDAKLEQWVDDDHYIYAIRKMLKEKDWVHP